MMEPEQPLEPCTAKRLALWATGERFDHDVYSLYGSIPLIRAAGFYVIMLQMSLTLGEECVGSTNMSINFLIKPVRDSRSSIVK
jgi:hypothetical protein